MTRSLLQTVLQLLIRGPWLLVPTWHSSKRSRPALAGRQKLVSHVPGGCAGSRLIVPLSNQSSCPVVEILAVVWLLTGTCQSTANICCTAINTRHQDTLW